MDSPKVYPTSSVKLSNISIFSSLFLKFKIKLPRPWKSFELLYSSVSPRPTI